MIARKAILDAAYAILIETGLADFSIDAVATRAGVARTTIYRWWPSKGILANESFLEAFKPQLAYRDSGSAADDFGQLLQSLAKALNGPAGRVAASVLAAAQSDVETKRLFWEEFSVPLRNESAKILKAGITSSQFRDDLDVERVLDAAVGAVYLRLLFGQSMDARWVEDLIETILRGCRN